MSLTSWKAENPGKKAVDVGGKVVDVPIPQELGISKEEWAARAQANALAGANALAPPEPFTGRNTQVRSYET